MLSLSTFANERDNRPRALSLTFDELVEKLRNARRAPCTLANCIGKKCPHKKCAAWSPAAYVAGKTRAKANVESISVLVLDHDHITNDQLCEIEGRLLDERRILHATHSDRPDDRCIRSVIELSKPVPASNWPAFWSAIVARLELPGVDPSACDASRLYFAPSRPSDAPYFFHAAEPRS